MAGIARLQFSALIAGNEARESLCIGPPSSYLSRPDWQILHQSDPCPGVIVRRLYQATALFFFALGVYPMWEARELTYWVVIGPGPGFFPFWLGALLALVSGVWFAQVTLRPVEPMSEDFIPGGAGAKKALLTLAALVLFIGLLDVLGFSLTMFGFLLFLILVLGRHNLLLTMTVSLVGSFGIYYVFKYLLSVHLPASSIGFLHSLGL